MIRPFEDKRPLGPFAQSSESSGLELVVFTNVSIPQRMRSNIKDEAEDSMGVMMNSVKVMNRNTGFVIDVGPEILIEHDQFSTYDDMLSAVTDELSRLMDEDVEVSEVTARCDGV